MLWQFDHEAPPDTKERPHNHSHIAENMSFAYSPNRTNVDSTSARSWLYAKQQCFYNEYSKLFQCLRFIRIKELYELMHAGIPTVILGNIYLCIPQNTVFCTFTNKMELVFYIIDITYVAICRNLT